MEPSGRNRWQPVANGKAPKRLRWADRQPVATHGNRFGAHGKEGVSGSSPEEGFAQNPCKEVRSLSELAHEAGLSRRRSRVRVPSPCELQKSQGLN
jgi:hypothetical protein